ncbi:unnamed protein product [Pedinophyceae sp. YPF-701]|nr:unnamed protein product [Pedinophyceae sp. YPF-701]
MDRYEKGEKLGDGTYGVVYRGVERATGRVVAMKKVLMRHRDKEGIDRTAIREIKLLKELDSEYVVRLYDSFVHKDNIWLVLEYCHNNLEHVITDRSLSVSEADVKAYARMAALGLAHCHERHVIHRDIKPNNFLFGQDGRLKLIDFGLSRTFGSPNTRYSPQVFNIWYRSPELLLGARKYGLAADVWALGCCIAELYRRKPLFVAGSELGVLGRILDTLGSPTKSDWPDLTALPNAVMVPRERKAPVPLSSIVPGASPAALDLLGRMLRWNPAARPTVAEVLAHPYFTGGVADTPMERLPHGRSQDEKASGSGGGANGDAGQGNDSGSEPPRTRRRINEAGDAVAGDANGARTTGGAVARAAVGAGGSLPAPARGAVTCGDKPAAGLHAAHAAQETPARKLNMATMFDDCDLTPGPG